LYKLNYVTASIPIPNYYQQHATILDIFIFTDALHISGGSSLPSSGAYNYTYSFRYCQSILLLAATVEEMEPEAVCTVMCS
jgi:hypothetical protein